MTRSIKTANRPEPHAFVWDTDVPPDRGVRFCRAVVPSSQDHGSDRRCALREDDSVHVPVGDLLPDRPEGDETSRILGEGGG